MRRLPSTIHAIHFHYLFGHPTASGGEYSELRDWHWPQFLLSLRLDVLEGEGEMLKRLLSPSVPLPNGLVNLRLPKQFRCTAEFLRALPATLRSLQDLRPPNPNVSIADSGAESNASGTGESAAAEAAPVLDANNQAWQLPAGLISLVLVIEGSYPLSDLTSRLPAGLDRLEIQVTHEPGSARLHPSLIGFTLPRHLREFAIDYWDEQITALQLPLQLERLDIGSVFSQPLVNWSPPVTLTRLELGTRGSFGMWRRPANELCLPPNLTSVVFPNTWNLPIDALHLPNSVERLEFGFCFDQPLDAMRWPNSLRVLRLLGAFQHSLADVHFPTTIEDLALGEVTLGDKGPRSLVAGESWHPPASLIKLDLSACHHLSAARLTLPTHLQSLALGMWFNPAADSNWLWPVSLTKLTLRHPSLRSNLGARWVRHAKVAMPAGWLPSTLCVLKLLDDFDVPVGQVVLPEGLRVLHFDANYSQSLAGLQLPSSLREFRIVARAADFGTFHQPLNAVHLPDGLERLVIEPGQCRLRPSDLPRLPASLKELQLASSTTARKSGWFTEEARACGVRLPAQCAVVYTRDHVPNADIAAWTPAEEARQRVEIKRADTRLLARPDCQLYPNSE